MTTDNLGSATSRKTHLPSIWVDPNISLRKPPESRSLKPGFPHFPHGFPHDLVTHSPQKRPISHRSPGGIPSSAPSRVLRLRSPHHEGMGPAWRRWLLVFGCDTCGVTWDVGDMYRNIWRMWRHLNMIHVFIIDMHVCSWIPNWLILRLERVLEVTMVGGILTSMHSTGERKALALAVPLWDTTK